MFNLISRFPNFLTLSFILLLSQNIIAQKAGLEVTRCTAVDRVLSIKNVAVETSGRRWAANSKGIFQVKAADLSTPLKVAPGEKNVLAFRGGNTDFAWSEAAFRRDVPQPCSVTAAWYDVKNQQLWLGTDEAGLFQFSTQPELKKLQQYKTVNSKLKSDNITAVFQDASGKLWVGTDKGVMSGKPGLWKGDLAGTNVQRIREYNTVIYVLADGFISKAPSGEKWTDLALDEKYLEGDINDFDIDPSGKMWLVSGNLTRFDLIAGTYDDFGGSEYYTSQYGNCIAVEADGVAWVGTEDKGLFMVAKAYNMVLNAYVDKPISCEGNGKDAVLMAKITGGEEPYTWTWTGGLSGESPKDVAPGTYSVTVTDVKAKARIGEIKVPDPRIKVFAKQKRPISAPGMSDGAASLEILPNPAGTKTIWDNGETLAVAEKLSAGEHTVTISDEKGCTVIAKVMISEVAQPVFASITEKVAIKCAGGNGILALEIKGGKKNYQIQWSNPSIVGEMPNNVTAGTYTVTVTDATKATCTAVITLKQPEALVVSALVQAPASTIGGDGKALAQAKGGTGAFFFKWDNGETVFAATKLPAGDRSLTVTDANGCSTTALFVIPENVMTLTVNISEKEKIKCADGKSALTVEVKGGKGGPKFAWNNPALSGKDPVNVPAGDYVVTVTDVAGTTQTATIKVKAPQPLVASAIAQGVVSPGGSDGKALCSTSGGSIVGHSFLWDNGEITAATLRLNAGLHYVTVTDDNGCTATASVMMTETVVPLEVSISEKTKIKCVGDKAALVVQVSGGKANYKYAWSNPSLVGESTTAAAGDYVLTVTDAAGATKTTTIKVVAPAPLSLVAEAQGALSPGKSDGRAIAKPIGGSAPFDFKWENGENTGAATRLAPGVSKVTVTDANGCVASASVTMSETFLPLAVSVSEKTSIKCAGEKAVLAVQVSGGKTGYKYVWSNPTLNGESPTAAAGNYVLTVSDATGATITASVTVQSPGPLTLKVEIQAPLSPGKSDGKAFAKPDGGASPFIFQWENGEVSSAATRLAPGISKVTVTDANGCTASASVTMSETFLPLAVSVSEKTSIKCAGEKAVLAVQVSGGKTGYKYVWSNPTLNGESPNAAVGNYVLTVSDATGATITASVTVQSPSPLTLKVEIQAPLSPGKSDGKAFAKPDGGTSPYTFQWENGEVSGAATRLAPGISKVTVTDANGCTASASVTMSETFLPLAVRISAKTIIRCSGEKANLETQVFGGKAKYSYVWSNPALNGESPTAAAGNYVLTVTDSNGASITASISVQSPTPLSAKIEVQASPSPGAIDGKALATVSVGSGTLPYAFKWDNGETTALATHLPPGEAKLRVTDANECWLLILAKLDETFLPLSVSISEKSPIKCSGEKANLEVQVSGGKAKYSYAWNNPAVSGESPSVAPGEYVLTVTDANGASKTSTVSVKPLTPLALDVIMQSPASTGNADGKAIAKPSGGTGGYIFQWESGESSSTASRLAPGNPKVTVTDANGCTAIGSVSITETILELTVSISEKTPIKCGGGLEKSSLLVNISGGKPSYSLVWNSPALVGESPDGLVAGDYAVTVTDAKGTSKTAKITVKAPEPMALALVKNIGASSATAPDGKAQISVKGGTAPYKIAWDTKQTGLAVSKLAAGKHSVTVTDAADCTQILELETGRRAMPELTRAIEQGQTIPMRLLTFATDSFSLRPAVYTYLDELYEFLVETPTVTIEVGGHTNNQPKDDFADYLSTERAKSVANYLIDKGIDAKRVQYKGYGKKQPLVPNTTPEGRKTNQRVEIKILTAGGK